MKTTTRRIPVDIIGKKSLPGLALCAIIVGLVLAGSAAQAQTPVLVSVFNGTNLNGWAQKPSGSFIVNTSDHCIQVSGTARGFCYTTTKYVSYRVIYSVRQLNHLHWPCALFFGYDTGLDAMGGIQFQLPNNSSWDYRPGHNVDPHGETNPITGAKLITAYGTVPNLQQSNAWYRCEILVNQTNGTADSAAEFLGGKGYHITKFTDPTITNIPCAFAFQSHQSGVYDEFKDVLIETNPQFNGLVLVSLPAPGSLKAVEASTNQINLTWTINSTTQSGIEVFNSRDNWNWLLVATLASKATNYSDTNLIPNSAYYYRVAAITTNAISDYATTNLTLITSGFSFSVAPSSQNVLGGNSTNFTVTVTTNGTFTGNVALGVAGVPPGATAGFSSQSLNHSGNSTLTINTTTNTPGGNYPLTISGTNGNAVVATNVTLLVIGSEANPGTLVWTAASGVGTNWSSLFNWTNVTGGGYGPPGASNSVVFTNTGTVPAQGTVNNYLDSSLNIISLQYSQTNRFHDTLIASGAQLTIASNLTVGTGTDLGTNGVVFATLGGSASLVITNTNCVVNVRQGTASASGPYLQRATLDLTGLNNFNSEAGRILVAGDGGTSARETGTLLLAQVNTITLSGSAPQIDVGDNPSNGAGANNDPTALTSYLYLGLANGIYTDSIGIGRSKGAGVLAFNPIYTNGLNPSLFLRGSTDSRVGMFSVGDESALGNSNQRSSGLADFSGGNVDAMIDSAYIGQGMNGNNTGTAVSAAGTLTFDDGTMDVNNLKIGYQTLATGTGPGAGGTVNVNGDGVLSVNQTIELAHGSASSPLEQGTLNLNGGTVQATNIVGGGGISTINLNSGMLDLQGAGQIAGVSTLNVGANGVNDSAFLQDAAGISVSNAIVIASNGVISGSTILTDAGLTVNGAISPGGGFSGGMTNTGPVALGAGGSFIVTVEDATSGAANGWSFFKGNNGINIQSASGNPFTISLQTPGELADNFDSSTNYDWVIASAAGGVNNFDPVKFAVNDSQFANDLAGGNFYARLSGNSLVLSFTNNHPPVASVTWLYRTGNQMTIPLSTLSTNWSDPDGDAVQLLSVDSSTNGAAPGSDANFIYYTNANDVADEISYTIEDVRTNPPAIYRAGDTQQTGTGQIIILPPPVTGNVKASGNNLVMSGAGGKPGGTYYVLGSTNLTLPITGWTILSTNSFDGGGNFIVTNSMDPGQPQWFYTLQAQ